MLINLFSVIYFAKYFKPILTRFSQNIYILLSPFSEKHKEKTKVQRYYNLSKVTFLLNDYLSHCIIKRHFCYYSILLTLGFS